MPKTAFSVNSPTYFDGGTIFSQSTSVRNSVHHQGTLNIQEDYSPLETVTADPAVESVARSMRIPMYNSYNLTKKTVGDRFREI